MTRRIIAVFVGLALSTTLLAQAPPASSPEVLLKAAMQKEQIDNDLPAAIAQYKAIVERFPKDAAAARALLQLGGIYERVQRPEALGTYQLVLAEHAAHTSLASEARKRIADLSIRTVRPSQSQLPIPLQVLGSFRSHVSPDGLSISYVSDSLRLNGDGNLGVWDLRSGETRLVTRSKGYDEGYVRESVWSPDGRLLAYCWFNQIERRYELRTVPSTGGTPRTLYRATGRGLLTVFAWSPDAKHVAATIQADAAPNRYQIALISTQDGSARILKAFDSVRRPGGVAFSPDGRYLAYDFPPSETSQARDIFLLNVGSGTVTTLIADPGSSDELLGWFPDGEHILYVCHWRGTREARAIRVSAARAILDPFTVKRDVGDVTGLGFARDGRFFSLKASGQPDVLVVPMDPLTTTAVGPAGTLPPASTAARGQATWSPDGKRIAYFEQTAATDWTLTVQMVETGSRRMYPAPIREPERPAWHPDGRVIAFHGWNLQNQAGQYRVNLETGSVDRMSVGHTGAFSPDGQFFFHPAQGSTGVPGTVQRLRLADGTEETVDRGPHRGMALSPDGRYLALFDPGVRPARPSSISITPASGGARRTIVEGFMEGAIDNEIAWSHDSRFVLFIANGVWRVPLEGGPPERVGIGMGGKHLSMSPDGRQLAISVVGQEIEAWVWENLLPKGKQ